MFLAGVLMPLPHLSIILLTLCGCLIAFQGAYHWGMIGQIPLIILPQREGRADYIRMLLGGGALLWAWFSLCLGLLATVQTGYCLELLGFWGIIASERSLKRNASLPPSYYLIKVIFVFLTSLGLIFALISPQGRF
ncbi:hypothetical protein DM15PD_17810 [Aristophania vespae]|nr:hypothetical protein DM15PD_17810 [Aristophania vespae]